MGTQPEGLQTLDSTTEPSIPTSSSPRGRGGMYGCPMSGRAPYPKGPLDLGHQRNVSFISPTLQKSHETKRSAPSCPQIQESDEFVESELTIRRSSRFACLLPSRVVFGLESAALNPPATRSGSRLLNGFLNPVLLAGVVVTWARRRDRKSVV